MLDQDPIGLLGHLLTVVVHASKLKGEKGWIKQAHKGTSSTLEVAQRFAPHNPSVDQADEPPHSPRVTVAVAALAACPWGHPWDASILTRCEESIELIGSPPAPECG